MHTPEGVQTKSFDNEENSIDFKKIFNKLTDKWYWFVFSVFICLLVAFMYARYTAPVYQINAKLLINEQAKSGGAAKSVLMDLNGLMGGDNSVENEVEILKSRSLVEQVVRDMDLNIVYSTKGKIGTRELYNPPFKLKVIRSLDTIRNTQLEIERISLDKFRVSADGINKDVIAGKTFSLKSIGELAITLDPEIKVDDNTYLVDIFSLDSRVASLMAGITVNSVSKQVSIINLSFKYPLPKKGEHILHALIKKYTEANISDKNAIADSTGKFIKERLFVISKELGDVENDVEGFKEANKLADISEQGRLLVQNTGELTNQLAAAETQVTVLTELENYLRDETNNKRVFPSSLISQDLVFSGMMNQYNSLLVEREKLLLSVTEESPFVQNIDNQIAGLRKGILGNIQNAKNAAVLSRNKFQTQLKQAEIQITGVPQIEKNYLKLARKQQIKQELYIFLMQKAEETAISKTSNMSIAKIIDPPKAVVGPISPKKANIYVVGLIVGLIFPIAFIYGGTLLTTSIATKEEIIALTQVPIVGEISHNPSSDNLIVANQSRSAISEQFRALRTNLAFYLKKQDEKVILLTSSMSGEGKSFTAINLGNILALAGKKVLLMELDLRKPGLSAKLGIVNDIGFSNYIISQDIKAKDVIKPLNINNNMFIVSSGPLPPNPAETIMSEYTEKLINELKEQFDYIIMDAPPIGVITDAQLLSIYADVTLYLVRQKITQKTQLNIVEDLYRNGKMKNIGIVVNDIENKYYGYGYGYGTYGNEEQDGFLTRIINKLKG